MRRLCFQVFILLIPTNLKQPGENGVAEGKSDRRTSFRKALDDDAQIAQRLLDLSRFAEPLGQRSPSNVPTTAPARPSSIPSAASADSPFSRHFALRTRKVHHLHTAKPCRGAYLQKRNTPKIAQPATRTPCSAAWVIFPLEQTIVFLGELSLTRIAALKLSYP